MFKYVFDNRHIRDIHVLREYLMGLLAQPNKERVGQFAKRPLVIKRIHNRFQMVRRDTGQVIAMQIHEQCVLNGIHKRAELLIGVEQNRGKKVGATGLDGVHKEGILIVGEKSAKPGSLNEVVVINHNRVKGKTEVNDFIERKIDARI